jgi:hypothetical protein
MPTYLYLYTDTLRVKTVTHMRQSSQSHWWWDLKSLPPKKKKRIFKDPCWCLVYVSKWFIHVKKAWISKNSGAIAGWHQPNDVTVTRPLFPRRSHDRHYPVWPSTREAIKNMAKIYFYFFSWTFYFDLNKKKRRGKMPTNGVTGKNVNA